MFTSVLALVGRHKLTAYDASYLELAIRHNLPIAALDNALQEPRGKRASVLYSYDNGACTPIRRGDRALLRK